MRLLPSRSRLDGEVPVRVVRQSDLRAKRKWGPYLRAPEVYFQTRLGSETVQLGEIARVQRGQTTGANRFFYLAPEQVAKWEIEPEFTKPLLKSPKELETIQVGGTDPSQRVLAVTQKREALIGTRVLSYIEWGESQRYHQRSTCARRSPWYSLPERGGEGDSVAWIKGIWNRHFSPLLDGRVVLDQQFYMLETEPSLIKVLAAVLNSTWVAMQAELLGRSNFGEGVLWLAGYEVSKIRLPDVRQLAPAAQSRLEDALERLSRVRVLALSEQVSQPAQQHLDAAVFDLLGLSSSERNAVVEAAVELTETRIRRARAGRSG
jgi:hypothetical protein